MKLRDLINIVDGVNQVTETQQPYLSTAIEFVTTGTDFMCPKCGAGLEIGAWNSEYGDPVYGNNGVCCPKCNHLFAVSVSKGTDIYHVIDQVNPVTEARQPSNQVIENYNDVSSSFKSLGKTNPKEEARMCRKHGHDWDNDDDQADTEYCTNCGKTRPKPSVKESRRITEAILRPGTKVDAFYNGRHVKGEIVNYNNGRNYSGDPERGNGVPSYIINTEAGKITVPAPEVQKL